MSSPYKLDKGIHTCQKCNKKKSEKEFILCYGGWICTDCHFEGLMHA